MSDNKAQKLLQGGIKAARSGQKDLARKAFTQVLKLEPTNEAAWLGMATVSDDPNDKIKILNRILDINPDNAQAKEALRRLGIEVEPEVEEEPIPEPPLVADDDDIPMPPLSGMDDDDDDIPMPPLPGMDDDIPMPPLPGMDDDDDDIPMPPLSGMDDDDDIPMPPLPGMDDDDDIPMPPLPGMDDDDDIPMPPLPNMDDDDDDIPMPPIPGLGSPQEEQAASASDWGIEEDEPKTPLRSLRSLAAQPATDDVPEEVEIEEEIDELAELGIQLKSSDEVFAMLPPPPQQGQAGRPVPPRDVVERLSQQAMNDAQAYLEDALKEYESITWEKKQRGRAGESEYTVFLLQVSAAVFVFLLIVGGATTVAVLRSATAQRFLFGPSDTPTFTPTFTPTHTPGPTNTPSQTPDAPPTASPELDPSITPGNPDQYFPPAPTEIYFVSSDNFGVATAIAFENRGETENSLEALQAERSLVASYEFTPTYYLVIYYLEQGDFDTAQQLVEDWIAENQDPDSPELQAEPFLPYVDAAVARLRLYEAEEALAAGRGADDLLTEAEENLTDILNEEEDSTGDIDFIDAYILMAERFRLEGRYDEALDVLTDAIQNRGFYGNTEVRFKRAQIFREQERYPEALQELYNILILNPFLESALLEQIEVALESGQAGLGVLYAQQYLLYYPGSVRGYYLLGQAREAENKNDLAINAYSRAVLGPDNDPYYLRALQARTDLYIEQGNFELAQTDLSEALALTNDNPNVRVQRMNAAFIAGDIDTALADAEVLLESGEVNDAEILLLQGRILTDREEYRDALGALQQATQRGLPPEARSLANEYLARANLGLNNLSAALTAIDEAIATEETGTRRYIRGQINQQRGSFDDALIDYEFVLTWGQVFDYDFFEEAEARYAEVIERTGGR